MQLILRSKYKFYLIIFISFVLPYVEFINFNSERLEPLLLKTLAYTLLFFIFITLLFSLIFSFFIKNKFVEVLSTFSLIILIFFNYDKLKSLLYFLFESFDSTFFGELAVISVFLISIISIFIMLKKKSQWFLNFISVYLSIFFILNLFNFYNLQKNFNKTDNDAKLPTDVYFSDMEIKNILNNQRNKNIYYIIMDAAIPLEYYNDNFNNIDVEKIILNYNKNKFTYIKNVDSSYSGTHLTVSQILNLSYFLNENSAPYNVSMLYPTVMSTFESTSLGRTLKKINYDFFWIGNAIQKCTYYNVSLCLPDVDKINNYFENFISNTRNLINTNYVLTNFLQKTPIIDFNNKIFLGLKTKYSAKEIAHLENDAVQKFMKSSHKLKKNNKNFFVFVHAIMPHGYAVPKNDPLIYSEDCSMKVLSKKEAKELTKDFLYFGGAKTGYETNYLCMLKRVDEFIRFINVFDSDAEVIIQADHGITDQKFPPTKIFTLVKTNNCGDYISNQIDNINAIRFLLSCATDQKVKLLPKKTFIEKRVPADHEDHNKVFLVNN